MVATKDTCSLHFSPTFLRKAALLALLLIFWWLSIWNLDRYPLVEEDEPWILSPGYKLFTQGIYGSNLFSGFHHMEQHYFEFMPLMSWLQGATTHLFGVGVLQMRWLAVALGLVTLTLAYALARRLISPDVGVVAVLLMIFWQWTPGNLRILGSGVPLVDLARIARYDVLVPPLGLGAIWAAWCARRTGLARYDGLAGLLGGLAGLAHLYGLFWLGAALLLRLAGFRGLSVRRMLRMGAWLLGGAVLAWLGWLVMVGINWPDFLAQTAQYSDRFDLWSIAFYLGNLAQEPQRYSLGLRHGASLWRLGFWGLVVGLPVAWLLAAWEAYRRRRLGLAWLCGLCLLFPVWFALLIRVKTFSYLLSVAPLWAMVLAWGGVRLFEQGQVGRWLAVAGISGLVLQGGLGIGQMQAYASQAEAPERMWADVRQLVPPTGRILGPSRYWLALPQRDYISLVLPFFLSNPQYNGRAAPFEAAVTQIGPQVVIVDLYEAEFQDNYAPPPLRHRASLLRDYLARHRARLVGTLRDNYGQPIEVYQLGTP